MKTLLQAELYQQSNVTKVKGMFAKKKKTFTEYEEVIRFINNQQLTYLFMKLTMSSTERSPS